MHSVTRRSAIAFVLAAATLSCRDAIEPTAPLRAPAHRLATVVPTPNVVISQVYGGGGNSGATYKNDFIELFNPGTSAVALDGWSVQYASSTGTSWHVTALSGSIQPGGYYLVQEAAGSGGTTSLPSPDATGTIAMAATAGKVALMSTTTAISGATCPASGEVDEVSFGSTATDCGAGHTAAPSNTTAALRNGGGCAFSGSLAADFATGAPNPRNHTSATHSCGSLAISQLYGGGGNTGATYTNDFIELFNSSGAAVSLDGWSVQYTSSTGSTWKVTPLHGTIAAQHYYLVQEAAGSGGTTALPTPDATGTIAMAASAGKIALVHDTAALTGSGAGVAPLGGTACPTAPAAGIADFVGYGTATCYEGTAAAPAPSATKSDLRRVDGSQDTNDNTSDFDAGTAAPRNSAYVPPTPGALDHVFISGGSRVVVGTPLSLGATAEDSNDVHIDAATFTWSTSDPSRATVDASGHVTAVNPGGLVTITATTTVDGITKSGSRILAVSSSTALSLSGRTPPLPVGFQDAMFASGGTAPITWISSNPSVLAVDSLGIITATGVGTATIAAFDANQSGAAWFVNTEAQTFSSTARSGHNTEFGVPTDTDPSNDVIVARKEYTLSYNPQRGGPNWVSWDLSATHLGSTDRCNCFTQDTALTRQGVTPFTTLDYISGGQYDRGHMEPSADQSTTDTENATTFFLSNVLPQRHDLNAGPWEKLEIALRDSVRAGREAYVIAGGIFAADTGLGSLNGAGKIFIPDSTWKIIVLMPAGEGLSDVHSASDINVIAVNMPNVTAIINNDWTPYLTTVDKIQQSTGYDFLSALPESIQCQVEGRSCSP
ncbi:MAG TPA: DNA/RNA non-specific endonuclease [Gemmatimonadaceae bacterium]|nr:DNA/RNA non-specific endonuclease [Gemmatimonadaceae bacterium]